MSVRHSNISIFVPHIGCPHQCSFCNQFSITGSVKAPKPTDIDRAVIDAQKSKSYNPKTTELAFFGGSFTAIDIEYQKQLLEAGFKHIKNGNISGIRISTRPDAINEEILAMLKGYGVTAIELGAQSLCDDVLIANNRGHSSEDVEKASALIKAFGFSLGLQMMTGLYDDTAQKDIFSAQKIISLKPDTVRIYPTIVLEVTRLSVLVKEGKFTPPSLEDTIDLVVKLLLMFKEADISVIRTGLHTIDENSYVAGPWHPAFKELCDSRIFRNEILKYPKGKYILLVNPKDISKVIGQKRENILFLKEKGYDISVKPDSSILENEIRMCN